MTRRIAAACLALLLLLACRGWAFEEGCTAFGATQDSVAGGGSLIARNRDKSERGLQVIVRRTAPKGLEYLGITSRGHRTLTAGINERGLIVVNTAASSDNLPRVRPAVSCDFFLRSCSTVAEVLARLGSGHAEGPINFLVGDPDGMAVVEIGRPEFRSVTARGGVLCHTNHYVLEGMAQYNRRDSESSVCRFARIHALLERSGDPLAVTDFMAFSRDHEPAPSASSICRHPYLAPSASQSGTLGSTIFLTRRGQEARIFVALGEPCLSDYVAFDFHDGLPHALTSGRAFLLAEEVSRAYWLINPREDQAVVRSLSRRYLQALVDAERAMAVQPAEYARLSALLDDIRRLINCGRFREALRRFESAGRAAAG